MFFRGFLCFFLKYKRNFYVGQLSAWPGFFRVDGRFNLCYVDTPHGESRGRVNWKNTVFCVYKIQCAVGGSASNFSMPLRYASPFEIPAALQYSSSLRSVSASVRILYLISFGLSALGLPILLSIENRLFLLPLGLPYDKMGYVSIEGAAASSAPSLMVFGVPSVLQAGLLIFCRPLRVFPLSLLLRRRPCCLSECLKPFWGLFWIGNLS